MGKTYVSSKDNKLADVNVYELLHDAYYGTGGFANGDYLVAHRRETVVKYESRKSIAYYLNYVAPVVNSHVDPIFKKEPAREYPEGDKRFSAFMGDTDMLGTDMTSFMKRAALVSKLKGVAFLVVDSPKEQPTTLAKQLEERAFPYVYVVEPDMVTDYTLDRFGRIVSFTYKEPQDDTTMGSNGMATQKYNQRTWTKTTWTLTNDKGEEKESGVNPLNKVPIIPLFSRKMVPGEILPMSEFYSIARANARIYNLCSELDEILRNQSFAILTYPGQKQPNSNQDVTVGTETMLGYSPEATNAPAFIAPPADPANMIMSQIDRLIKEIYRMAALDSVVATVDGTQTKTSGVAKQWDFEKTNRMLADFATNCEDAEKAIVDLYNAWTNSNIEYTATYGDDFGIDDVNEELDKATKALDLLIGGQFDVEIKKRLASIIFADLDDERFDAVIAAIEADQENKDLVDKTDKQAKTEENILRQKQAKVTDPKLDEGVTV